MNRQLLGYAIKRRGKTQDDVARFLGISRQSLQNRLKGAVDTSTEEAAKLQKYLKLTDEDVLEIFFRA